MYQKYEELIEAVRAQKEVYKTEFDKHRELKSEAAYLERMTEKAKAQVVKQYEACLERAQGGGQEAVSSNTAASSGGDTVVIERSFATSKSDTAGSPGGLRVSSVESGAADRGVAAPSAATGTGGGAGEAAFANARQQAARGAAVRRKELRRNEHRQGWSNAGSGGGLSK